MTRAQQPDTVGLDMKNERMVSLREALGWTQADLAKASKLTQGTISRIERGTTEEPDPATQREIARALGTTTVDLFGHSAVDAPSTPGTKPSRAVVRVGVTTQLERLIVARASGFELEDVDAARETAREASRIFDDNADLESLAIKYLSAARRLRLRGDAATPLSVLAMASVMSSNTSERAISEMSAIENAEGAAEIEALRNPPKR
jgi:transcriptional regulator with XRE-family HTH domain